jgi:SAM-dependent methyltransferase
MTDPAKSYNPNYFEPLFQSEDRHFWFQARNQIIHTLMEKELETLSDGYTVLEVGCGTGNVLRMLEIDCKEGVVIGMDLFHDGLLFAQKRVHCGLLQADLNQPPFRTGLDIIGMFDVLEHISEDQVVLNNIFQLIKPGGKLILTVPAFQRLFSYFDQASCHIRRYEYVELNEKLAKAGFTVEYMTFYMMITYPIIWLRRIGSRKMDQAIDEINMREQALAELKIIPVVNEILLALLDLEARWVGKRRRLPVGTSLVAVACKPT